MLGIRSRSLFLIAFTVSSLLGCNGEGGGPRQHATTDNNSESRETAPDESAILPYKSHFGSSPSTIPGIRPFSELGDGNLTYCTTIGEVNKFLATGAFGGTVDWWFGRDELPNGRITYFGYGQSGGLERVVTYYYLRDGFEAALQILGQRIPLLQIHHYGSSAQVVERWVAINDHVMIISDAISSVQGRLQSGRIHYLRPNDPKYSKSRQQITEMISQKEISAQKKEHDVMNNNY